MTFTSGRTAASVAPDGGSTVAERNALQPLYGDGHLNATRTRECVAMPGVRDQRVLTPQCVVDGLLALWADGVAYDAAGAPESLIGAARQTETRGLVDPWPDRTYCNPPYGECLFDPETQRPDYLIELELRRQRKAVTDARKKAKKVGEKPPATPMPALPPGLPLKKAGLIDWLDQQLRFSEGESVMLVPNRTHRRWLRMWRAEVDGLVELDPLAFLGAKSAAPFPLVFGYVGPRVDAFHKAFAHLGDPV